MSERDKISVFKALGLSPDAQKTELTDAEAKRLAVIKFFGIGDIGNGWIKDHLHKKAWILAASEIGLLTPADIQDLGQRYRD